jgi:hypothetical protein
MRKADAAVLRRNREPVHTVVDEGSPMLHIKRDTVIVFTRLSQPLKTLVFDQTSEAMSRIVQFDGIG